ncbi:MAG: DNA mismatch repair protein MutS, partial [Pseudobdellovibrionaceae bacterium]
MAASENQTPLMKQYWEIKSAHPDKILLFRMGDFFEMFFDDAIKAAPILGIALTQRNKKSEDQTPMCGMPHHSIATPINKLLAAGYKVAICDQIEDPKMAKGIVKRAVTRIMSPGMVYDSDTLEATRGNYLVCFEKGTIAFLDSSTGEAFCYNNITEPDLRSLCALLVPSEIVVSPEHQLPIWDGFAQIRSECGDFSGEESLPIACRRLLGYATKLAGSSVLSTFRSFEEREKVGYLELSPTVIRHLEIFETFKGEKEGSLFRAIDKTRTSPGARLLRHWMSFPLRDKKALAERQKQIQYWTEDLASLKGLRDVLSSFGDIERRLGRISNPSVSPRDLQSVAASLRAGHQVLQRTPFAQWSDEEQHNLLGLSELIDRTLLDELPLTSRQGYVIRQGVSTELDEYVRLATDSQSLLQEMENREKEKTGISSLKIRYNQVFGYYIEVTHTHKDKVPKHYMRKQTLTNAERYCTDELVELE